MEDLLLTQVGKWRAVGVLLICSFIASVAQAQLSFHFIQDTPTAFTATSTDSEVLAGITAAAKRWSSEFTNHVTLSIKVEFKPLPNGVIADTDWTPDFVSYSDVRKALLANANTAAARSAVEALPSGNTFKLVTNHTTQDPHSNAATPYLDANGSANNTTICLTQGDARALSLFSSTAANPDATITFNSNYSNLFDFDPSDGISAGKLDFVGTAAHELGHSLGFTSGVDTLDYYAHRGTLPEDAFTEVSALDLFRYSTLSRSDGEGVIDWSADARPKYFSIDGGTTPLAYFSTGMNFGDGGQASHWKDGRSLGIMNPTTDPGELLRISDNDLTALNVIGWNFSSVPEPSTYGIGSVALALIGALVRRFRTNRSKR